LRRPERSPVTVQAPRRHIAPTVVEQQFRVPAKIGSLAVVRGEHECSNDDIIRNTAYNWSAMTADDIARKTGILARRYTERDVRELARDAAVSAVEHAGLTPSDVGAVLVLSCTNPSPIPSAATWLSSELGIYQTRASHDVVAACAGFSYGLADAVRLIQEIDAPVLVVCAEKFSDKIGTVRTSRMIFGDAAAALVIAPASRDEPSDIEVLQTYASGPSNEVNSIVWPNPEFDDNLTIVGPDVRSLVARYLQQIVDELRSLPSPDASPRTLFDDIELVVPHQANKTMVEELIAETGMSRERVFFNIERVGNVSAASIPVAIADAVHSGAIDRRMRVLTPGFGAGGVAGYAVLFLDPEIVAPEVLASHPGLHLERCCQ
jgi:3-oxoacyl-(acyl-carrier-protein) synthase III